MVQREYCWRQLASMNRLCRRFYTAGQTQSALEAATRDRDNFASAVRFAAQNLVDIKTTSTSSSHRDGDEDDTSWWSLATNEAVVFLGEFLPADAYRGLFDALADCPVEGDPPRNERIPAKRFQPKAQNTLDEGDLWLQESPNEGSPTAEGSPFENDPGTKVSPDEGDAKTHGCLSADGDFSKEEIPGEGDPRASSRRCRALSALAYGAAVEGRFDRAAVHAAAAYDLMAWVDDEARAFCLYSLAVVCRQTDRAKAASLARRALDVYRSLDQQQPACAWSPPERIRSRETIHHDLKSATARPPRMGTRAIHIPDPADGGGSGSPHDLKSAAGCGGCSPSVHAAELLASILTDLGATQSALNACRLSDEAGFQTLDAGHPLTVRGYLVRQHLWTTLGLAERARQAAVKAAESALVYYAEEHPQTGVALACLCECSGHRRPLDESICDAIHALAVRIKVPYVVFIFATCTP